ncbi:hypothetical protein Q9L42_009905 [Methylomarinum sp. Ch1-1]|uniref:TonB-dependent receptor n=1 Tax=Methylomarinum roseum TaxID=3067653 RepID=A0AAU7NZA9_9GAMM|nr:hypothetical protein [Methylomarinum sp. Ch1-1]MDP4521437.1 hypothetical protein [Methylomarinum sp. Ch1-1]
MFIKFRPNRLTTAMYLALIALPVKGASQADSTTEGSAQHPNEASQLDTVTVTGDWLGVPSDETIKTYPGARSVITETELHESGSRNPKPKRTQKGQTPLKPKNSVNKTQK